MQIPVHQMNGIAFLEGASNAAGDSFGSRTFSGIFSDVNSHLLSQYFVEDTKPPLSNHTVIFPAKGVFV